MFFCCCNANPCQFCFHLTESCAGATLTAPATVTVSQGGVTKGTCSSSAGSCCITGLTAGSYNYSVAATGYATKTGTVTLACPLTNVNVTLTPTANSQVTFTVNLCSSSNCNPSTVTPVTIALTGAGTQTITLTSGGHHTYSLPSGTYTATYSAPGFASFTESFGAPSGCFGVSRAVDLQAAAQPAWCFPDIPQVCGLSPTLTATLDGGSLWGIWAGHAVTLTLNTDNPAVPYWLACQAGWTDATHGALAVRIIPNSDGQGGPNCTSPNAGVAVYIYTNSTGCPNPSLHDFTATTAANFALSICPEAGASGGLSDGSGHSGSLTFSA